MSVKERDCADPDCPFKHRIAELEDKAARYESLANGIKTLRDEMAMAALCAVRMTWSKHEDKSWSQERSAMARVAYEYAVAMLEARKK